MPLFSIRVDNKQVQITEQEIVLVPNIDADGKRLPTTVKKNPARLIDARQKKRADEDNELLPVRVVAEDGGDVSGLRLGLRISQQVGGLFNFFNAGRRLIKPENGSDGLLIPLELRKKESGFFIEANAIQDTPQSLELIVEARDKSGALKFEQGLRLRIPPLVFISDDEPAERLYICSIYRASKPDAAENFATISDVIETLKKEPVKVVEIPADVSGADSWIQDQFQPAYFEGDPAGMRVILHTPRLRSDGRLDDSRNGLPAFITSHFPSAGIGVCNNFWERNFRLRGTDQRSLLKDLGKTAFFEMSFDKTIILQALFSTVKRLVHTVTDVLLHASREKAARNEIRRIRKSLPLMIAALAEGRLQKLITEAGGQEESPHAQELVKAEMLLARYAPLLVKQIHPYPKDENIVEISTSKLQCWLYAAGLDKNFLDELDRLHSTFNYGGNLEASPRNDDAPGKLIVGSGEEEFPGDPAFLSFLRNNSAQPLVLIDSSWLKVSHADEMVNFVSARKPGEKFSVAFASHSKAIEILRAIFRYNKGLPLRKSLTLDYYEALKTSINNPAGLIDGSRPVTRMFRGKHWLHTFPDNFLKVSSPPDIYLRLSEFHGKQAQGVKMPRGNKRSKKMPYHQLPVSFSHYYEAAIGVHEVLYATEILALEEDHEESFHELFKRKITAAKDILEEEFPHAEMLELPVIFDTTLPAVAFSPNLVNFQTVNDMLLLSRPYGPRMGMSEAIYILRQIMPAQYHPYITQQFFESNGLDITTHWSTDYVMAYNGIDMRSRKENPPLRIDLDLDWLQEQFADGWYPGHTDADEIKKQIRNANRGKFRFNGKLKKGWQKLIIPEHKVDIFEAYTQVLVAPTGMKVRWIDTWYYHLRGGGMHCATNVLRKARE
jgi:hypothetical protein